MRRLSRKARPAALEPVPGLPPWAVVLLVVWAAYLLHYVGAWVPWSRALSQWAFSSWQVTLPALLRHCTRLTVLAALLAVVAGSGRRILDLLGVAAHNAWEDAALSFGLGYGAWGTALLLLGLAGAWSRPVFLAAGLIALGPALMALRGLVARFRAEAGQGPRPGPSARAASAIFLIVWLYQLRFALIPETFYDALEYHLGVPSHFLNLGRIAAMPENSYSAIPSLPSMLYGWTLAFDPWGILASLLHCSIMLWLAASFLGLAKRLGRAEAGVLACAIFYTTPVVMAESFRVSVGLEWAFLQLSAFTGLLAAVEQPEGSTSRRGWLVLAGLFLGFTMSTKYPAWLLPAAFLAAARGRLTAREVLLAAAAALAVLSPWILKNLWLHGNPIYPFLHERLNAGALHRPDLAQLSAGGPDLKTAAGLWRWLGHPWAFLRPPGDMAETVGPCYLLLLPLMFFARLTPAQRLLALLCAGVWLPLSLATSVTRMFIPGLAGLALLLACCVESLGPGRKAALALALFCLSATGAAWYVLDVNQKGKVQVFLGRTSYSEFLGHTAVSYPTPPYAGIEYINAQSAPGAVLVMGEARTFYLRRPVVAVTPDQRSVLEAWSDASPDGPALLKRFRERDVRFILVNHGEMMRLRPVVRFTPSGKAAFDAFWSRYTRKEFEVRTFPDRFVTVYRVLTDEEAAQPHPADDLFSVYRPKA